MTWLSKSTLLLLVLLWLPTASHCDLEHLPGFEFLVCCDHADTEPHQDADCQTDVCALIEAGNYKLEEQGIMAPAPALAANVTSPLATFASDSILPTAVTTSTVPIELPRLWQFSQRVALSPRAPSSAS